MGFFAAIATLMSSPIRAVGTVPADLHPLTAAEIKSLLTDVSWQFLNPTVMDAPSEYDFHADGTFESGGGRAPYGGKVAISNGQFCLIVDPKYPGECWQVLSDGQHHIYFAVVHPRTAYEPVLVTLKKLRR